MNSKSKPSKKNNFFPPIVTLGDAQAVAQQGTWAACFVMGMTTIVAIASMFGLLPATFPVNAWALIDAALFAGIAWGIYQMSRVAALAGLIIYCIERVYMQIALGPKVGAGIIVTMLLICAFINAVRGTFAYHRLKQEGPRSVE
ncbi:hypothetical protein [Alkalinema sp. FACHB-956]|uniref:hypothetical protein n=1 Tax=Alkalinema sp. FACHB-956 TaxID=2692768 RepID=UPI0016821C42|nr:hypothetical protein [Alkalinema sp. FACHB-956]MBD2328726.1 hypothetical protein [Alkalinema sp. FACHB-956]